LRINFSGGKPAGGAGGN